MTTCTKSSALLSVRILYTGVEQGLNRLLHAAELFQHDALVQKGVRYALIFLAAEQLENFDHAIE